MVSRFRVALILFLILGFFSYLVFNLYRLQIEQSGYYSDRAASQYQLAGFLEPHRGVIYFTDKDRELVPVAINKPYKAIFAVPKEVEDAQEAANTLAPILNIDPKPIIKALENKKSLYSLLKKRASAIEVTAVKEINLKGIYFDDQEIRSYPFDSLASHLIGYIGPTDSNDQLSGRYGVERKYEDLLAGVPGDVNGDKISRPVQGEDLVLTIDRNIQSRAEEILIELVNKFQAKGGSVIVQNPKTGDLLALGSFPNFNPNSYSKSPLKDFLNPIHQSIYEPGSIFKVVTMASALDASKVTPETTYYDNGHLTLNGRVIRNWDLKAYGTQTMTGVIEQSLNVGSAFAVSRLGKSAFYDYLTKFGFTKPTGIQLDDEVVGSIENVRSGREINLATASFGQGISVTPLAMINAVSAIANQGVLMRPNILSGEKPEIINRVVSVKAAKEITDMMVSAVKKAKIAQVPSYNIAGKTGTAQVPDFDRGGYTDEVINTYAGFGPASDPRFVILFKLDLPAGAPLAGQTVVPAFRELAEFILNYYNIPPDNLNN